MLRKNDSSIGGPQKSGFVSLFPRTIKTKQLNTTPISCGRKRDSSCEVGRSKRVYNAVSEYAVNRFKKGIFSESVRMKILSILRMSPASSHVGCRDSNGSAGFQKNLGIPPSAPTTYRETGVDQRLTRFTATFHACHPEI